MTRSHRKSKLASFCAENIFRKSHRRNFGCLSRCLSKLQKCALGGNFTPPLAVEGLRCFFFFLGFVFYFSLYFDLPLQAVVYLRVIENLYITMMALVGFSTSAVQALAYQNGDYMGSLNKKVSGAQCFIMGLGLFWDIAAGLPWTPNDVGSLEPRGTVSSCQVPITWR